MIIYKVTNKITGRIYIGQTIRPLAERWKYHQWQTSCRYLHNSILKYGAENFTVEQIDVACSKAELDQKEKYWIEYYNSIVPNGYNLQSGGKHCEFSKETRLKISKSLTGIKRSEITKRKMSENHWDSSGEKNPNFGKERSESTKAKIMLSQPKCKKVLCCETGEVYFSISEASRKTGVNRQHISDVINRRRKRAGGFTWEEGD